MDITEYPDHCPACHDTFTSSFEYCPNFGCDGEIHAWHSAACDEECPA